MKQYNHNFSHANCACGRQCLNCSGEKLSVNCGCGMEAKQYEYKLDEQLRHETHDASMEPVAHAGHDMSKMSHMDHEAAMKSPEMAKEMEKDMRQRKVGYNSGTVSGVDKWCMEF